jgi:hypothetical protein
MKSLVTISVTREQVSELRLILDSLNAEKAKSYRTATGKGSAPDCLRTDSTRDLEHKITALEEVITAAESA